MHTDHTGHSYMQDAYYQIKYRNVSYKQEESRINRTPAPAKPSPKITVLPDRKKTPTPPFNCYAYAINKTDDFYRPGGIAGNPMIEGSSAETILDHVRMDMKAMNISYMTALGPNSRMPSGSNMIAMRAERPGGAEDYHFMVKKSGDSFWSFKSGESPVFKIEGGLNPSQVSWDGYQNMTVIGEPETWDTWVQDKYTGPIKYIIVTP